MDFGSIVWNGLMGNSVAQGVILKVVTDVVKAVFKQVDATDLADQVKPWAPVAVSVLSAVVSVLTALQNHSLSNLPVDAFLNWVVMMVAFNGTGTKTVVKAVETLKK